MPGRNHTIEVNFLDALQENARPAAMNLLHDHRLRQMLDMRLDGPSETLMQRHELTLDEWQTVLNAVILTKVSYFELSHKMSVRHLAKLIEIAAFCLNQPGASLLQLIDITKQNYPYMADWLKKALSIQKFWLKQQKGGAR